ncbi:hypothetical protein RJ639_009081 [Escallonia herrerae]|uniref:S-locus glycoprotein domain-containing protein n=1 Tax=Escallonia herrerae TaxID=1293975 RepID=A0AA88VVN3_9ASTE|nr:hypothetical protein RJ639_009081 [Escallonia herrerae]
MHPVSGSFSFGVDPLNIPQVFTWKDSNPYWRSGPWNRQIFIGIPNMDFIRNNGFLIVPKNNGSIYVTFSFANQSILTYFVLNSKGCPVQKCWFDGYEDWTVNWTNLENESTQARVVDWSKRMSIIEGVGRGLLYLHRDSRLRIIHRDLKARSRQYCQGCGNICFTVFMC